MPYGRRRYRRRGRYRRKKYMPKSYIKSKTGRKSQANQIVSLQRQIKSLAVKQSDNSQYVQYQKQFVQSDGAPLDLTGQIMYAFPLVDPKNWAQIFQADNRTDNSNKFRGRSMGLQMQFILGNTEEPCPPLPVYVYVVSLRQERGQEFLTNLGTFTEAQKTGGKPFPAGSVNKWYARTSVEEGVVSDMQSLLWLNKGVFKIHMFKRFFIGNQLNWANAAAAEDNYPSTNIRDANKLIYHKQQFSNLITPGQGQWKDMNVADLATKDNLMLLVHYDKPTSIEPNLTMSATAIFTGKVTN